MQTEIVETNIQNLVTKSNMLIEANYKLGVTEQKIVLCLASNIQPTDSDFKTYSLPIKEFNKILGLKGSPKYTELRKITKEMMQKVFEIKMPDNSFMQVAWLSAVRYRPSEGTVEIRFDPFLRPYLLELKKEFTSYKLENVVKLKSSYAIRLYELLKQYERIKERTFSLDDLREKLGAEDIYPLYGSFKQRVLVPAQKELQKKTDISFEIEEIKEGRRVSKIKLIITSLSKGKTEQLRLFDDFSSSEVFSKKARKLLLRLGETISDETLNSWEKYGHDRVISLLEQIQDKKHINSPIGYITSILKSGKAEAAATVVDGQENHQEVILFLVSDFRKSKESIPDWFVTQRSIEMIKEKYALDVEEAKAIFDTIKAELFELLNIPQSDQDFTDEEFERERAELEKKLKQFK